MISANNAWCLGYDNLSSLSSTLSDALCRLSTGGGFSTREQQAAQVVTPPQDLPQTIQSIQTLVSEHFYMPEMRDPDLTARTHRRAYVLPRQIAMYIVRQLTMASLQEIGREFGGRHHTTVLHALRKIEEMRRADKALDSVIARLMDAVSMQT
jgi:chromosomal replication initiation ATPase DnaA